MKRSRPRNYVYCIQEQCRDAFAPIKIGIAVNPQGRMVNLQVGNPMLLSIYGLIGPITKVQASRLESDLHIAMSGHRIRGEWFSGRALPHFDEAKGLHDARSRQAALASPELGNGNGEVGNPRLHRLYTGYTVQ